MIMVVFSDDDDNDDDDYDDVDNELANSANKCYRSANRMRVD